MSSHSFRNLALSRTAFIELAWWFVHTWLVTGARSDHVGFSCINFCMREAAAALCASPAIYVFVLQGIFAEHLRSHKGNTNMLFKDDKLRQAYGFIFWLRQIGTHLFSNNGQGPP